MKKLFKVKFFIFLLISLITSPLPLISMQQPQKEIESKLKKVRKKKKKKVKNFLKENSHDKQISLDSNPSKYTQPKPLDKAIHTKKPIETEFQRLGFEISPNDPQRRSYQSDERKKKKDKLNPNPFDFATIKDFQVEKRDQENVIIFNDSNNQTHLIKESDPEYGLFVQKILNKTTDDELSSLPIEFLQTESGLQRTETYIKSKEFKEILAKYPKFKYLANPEVLKAKTSSAITQEDIQLVNTFFKSLIETEQFEDFVSHYEIFDKKFESTSIWQKPEIHLLELSKNESKFKQLSEKSQEFVKNKVKEIQTQQEFAKESKELVSKFNLNQCTEQDNSDILFLAKQVEQDKKLATRLSQSGNLSDIYKKSAAITLRQLKDSFKEISKKKDYSISDLVKLKGMYNTVMDYEQNNPYFSGFCTPGTTRNIKQLKEFNSQLEKLEQSTAISLSDLDAINRTFDITPENIFGFNSFTDHSTKLITQFDRSLISNLSEISTISPFISDTDKSAIKNLTACALELKKRDIDSAEKFLHCLDAKAIKEFCVGAGVEGLNYGTNWAVAKTASKLAQKYLPVLAKLAKPASKLLSKIAWPLQVGSMLYNLYNDYGNISEAISGLIEAVKNKDIPNIGKYFTRTSAELFYAFAGCRDIFKSAHKQKKLPLIAQAVDDGIKDAKFGKVRKKADNMKDFFRNFEFGKLLKSKSDPTKLDFQGKKIYKITEKIHPYLKKGDYIYLDALHLDHIEVFDKNKNFVCVLNLNGSFNKSKTVKALNENRKIKF